MQFSFTPATGGSDTFAAFCVVWSIVIWLLSAMYFDSSGRGDRFEAVDFRLVAGACDLKPFRFQRLLYSGHFRSCVSYWHTTCGVIAMGTVQRRRRAAVM